MNEYRVTWCQCPHVKHTTMVLFIKAHTADDAKIIARDHIERKYGIEWFSVLSSGAVSELPEGCVTDKV